MSERKIMSENLKYKLYAKLPEYLYNFAQEADNQQKQKVLQLEGCFKLTLFSPFPFLSALFYKSRAGDRKVFFQRNLPFYTIRKC